MTEAARLCQHVTADKADKADKGIHVVPHDRRRDHVSGLGGGRHRYGRPA